jgi:hypothetical protein
MAMVDPSHGDGDCGVDVFVSLVGRASWCMRLLAAIVGQLGGAMSVTCVRSRVYGADLVISVDRVLCHIWVDATEERGSLVRRSSLRVILLVRLDRPQFDVGHELRQSVWPRNESLRGTGVGEERVR